MGINRWIPIALLALFLLLSTTVLHTLKCHPYWEGFRSKQLQAERRRTIRHMFSGIVEEIGTVLNLEVNNQLVLWDGSIASGLELTVLANSSLQEAYVGCSIAVNGVCLTAISYDHEKFTVGLAPETLRRSNLGNLQAGRYAICHCSHTLSTFSSSFRHVFLAR